MKLATQTAAEVAGAEVDPMQLAVLGGYLEASARDMGITMMKTARSTIFHSGHDFSCGIADAEGRMLALEEALPIHLGGLGFACRGILETYDEAIEEGDVLLMNDPFRGGSHLADWTVAMPVHGEGRILFWGLLRAHQMDIGGNVAGAYNPWATEYFQEGVRIPPLKIYERGEPRRDVVRFLLANGRLPETQAGDLLAMVGALRTANRKMTALIDKHGAATLERVSAALIETTERSVRSQLEELPDGVYYGESYCDGPSVCQTGEHKVAVTVTVAGSDLTFDFAGTDPQMIGGMNSPISNTSSSVYLAVICGLLDPATPHNQGCYAPIHIVAEEGTLVNPVEPAAVNFCTDDVATEIVEAAWLALHQAAPERVPAAYGRSIFIHVHGHAPQTERFYATSYFLNRPGGGAMPGLDGPIHSGPAIEMGALHSPGVEMLELQHPYHRHATCELVTDSGGAGQWRGGLGFIHDVVSLDHESSFATGGDGFINETFGLEGGQPGSLNRVRYGDLDDIQEQAGLDLVTVKPGQAFGFRSSGGGGWGDPLDRDPEAVRDDVLDGYVSLAAADETYGVVLSADRREVDEAATVARRQELRAAR